MRFIRMFMETIRTRQSKRLLAVLLAALLLFSGCAEPPEDDPGIVIPPVNPAATPKADVIQNGGTLKIPVNRTPATLHPLFVREAMTRNLYSMIFEPLIALDASREPVACLAQNWTYAEEKQQWELEMRTNVHWHDGLGDVTAEDAAFTVNTILANPDSCYYPMLSLYLSGAETFGSKLILHALLPSRAVLYALNFPVIPKRYYEGKDPVCFDTPRGSGCFAVEALDTENLGGTRNVNTIVLTPNADWWKKLPYLARVEAIGFASSQSVMAAFAAGELDCAPTGLRTSEIYEILSGVNHMEYLSQKYVFLGFNLKRGYTRQKQFRQALAYAVNPTEIINNVYLTKASRAELPLYNDSLLSSAGVKRYDVSVTRTKTMLEALGFADADNDGFFDDLTLHLAVLSNPADPVREEVAQTVAAELAEAGVNVEVAAMAAYDLQSAIELNDYDMIISGYALNDVPNLRFCLTADGPGNICGYDSAEMEAYLDQVDAARTAEELKTAVLAIQNLLAEDLPMLGLVFEMSTLLYRDTLSVRQPDREGSVFADVNLWYYRAE